MFVVVVNSLVWVEICYVIVLLFVYCNYVFCFMYVRNMWELCEGWEGVCLVYKVLGFRFILDRLVDIVIGICINNVWLLFCRVINGCC